MKRRGEDRGVKRGLGMLPQKEKPYEQSYKGQAQDHIYNQAQIAHKTTNPRQTIDLPQEGAVNFPTIIFINTELRVNYGSRLPKP